MNTSYTLAEAVEHLESVSIDAQNTLREIILETMYRKNTSACFIDRGHEIAELESANLAVRVDDPVASMRFLGRNELMKCLIAAGIQGFKKNCSLNALVDWCMENAPTTAAEVTSDVSAVVPSPEIGRVRKKIYIYMVRKFDNDSYFDPDTNSEIDFPHGATFSVKLNMNEESGGLQCEFPEDEITELLDKYGCNRCRSWKKPE